MKEIQPFLNFVANTDLEELQKQKFWLLDQNTPETAGLVSFLDYFQDMLIDDYGYSEEEVFGKKLNDRE